MAELTCYDCIHCGRCNDIEGGYSCHCSDVSKCKHFKNKVDFVEVVRCKECQHAYIDDDRAYCRNMDAPWYNDYFEVFTNVNDFCSYGEKKEKNENRLDRCRRS